MPPLGSIFLLCVYSHLFFLNSLFYYIHSLIRRRWTVDKYFWCSLSIINSLIWVGCAELPTRCSCVVRPLGGTAALWFNCRHTEDLMRQKNLKDIKKKNKWSDIWGRSLSPWRCVQGRLASCVFQDGRRDRKRKRWRLEEVAKPKTGLSQFSWPAAAHNLVSV